MINFQLLLMLVRETLVLHNMEQDGIQEEEDFIHMKLKTITLKPAMINSQPPLMLVRETLVLHNTELDGIQEEEVSIHMKLKTIIHKSVHHQVMQLLIQIDQNMNMKVEMLVKEFLLLHHIQLNSIQEQEDSMTMKDSVTMLK